MTPLKIVAILRLHAVGRLPHRFGYCPDEGVPGIRVTGCRVCDALAASDRWKWGMR